VPDPKIPLEPDFKAKSIANWVIRNRQNHVLKLMAYEEYEVWPILTDMVREKAIFGNPLEARKFCKALKKKGAMVSWIRENGGESYIEATPVYKRIPTDEQIIKEIYEVARVRSARKTQQNKDLQELQLLLQQVSRHPRSFEQNRRFKLILNRRSPQELGLDKLDENQSNLKKREDKSNEDEKEISVDSDRSSSRGRTGRRSSISRKGGGGGGRGRRTTSSKGGGKFGGDSISAQGSTVSTESDVSNKSKRSTKGTKKKVRLNATAK
jgi:hypothetical protein